MGGEGMNWDGKGGGGDRIGWAGMDGMGGERRE